jgi:hypothetical protein
MQWLCVYVCVCLIVCSLVQPVCAGAGPRGRLSVGGVPSASGRWPGACMYGYHRNLSLSFL